MACGAAAGAALFGVWVSTGAGGGALLTAVRSIFRSHSSSTNSKTSRIAVSVTMAGIVRDHFR